MSKLPWILDRFEWVTFDCYGTLIDWETGIISSLAPLLKSHGISLTDEKLLEIYGELEATLESDTNKYMLYREVLAQVVVGLGERVGFRATEAEKQSLPDSLGSWVPFPDTVQALRKLKRRYKLGIISNTDDDLFALSAKRLDVLFDEVVTAQQARSYKPALTNFRLAIQRLGAPATKILHVAQSVYHDIVPAKKLGLANVWVNRRAGKNGTGATKTAVATPDLEVQDLRTLADLAC